MSTFDRDPLPEGHVFSYSRRTVSGLPNFISDRTADLPEIESQWPLRTHPATFEFCDPRWRPMIRERVLAHLEEMRPADIAEMQRWKFGALPGVTPPTSPGPPLGRLRTAAHRIGWGWGTVTLDLHRCARAVAA